MYEKNWKANENWGCTIQRGNPKIEELYFDHLANVLNVQENIKNLKEVQSSKKKSQESQKNFKYVRITRNPKQTEQIYEMHSSKISLHKYPDTLSCCMLLYGKLLRAITATVHLLFNLYLGLRCLKMTILSSLWNFKKIVRIVFDILATDILTWFCHFTWKIWIFLSEYLGS